MSTLNKLLRVFLFALSAAVPIWVSAHGHNDHHASSEQTAFGKPGKDVDVSRTVEITMGDNMRFVPDHILVKQGETLRIRLVNTGKSAHEFVLGTVNEITEHAELMKKFPMMEHNDPSSARAEAGMQKEIIWSFNKPGSFVFACLIPGHSEAGMRGTIEVETDTSTATSADADDETGQVTQQSVDTSDLSEGEIIKVDTAQAKFTIKHGELKNMKMPGMTMVFQLKNLAWINEYHAGDKVRFRADLVNGSLTVIQIEIKP